MTCPACGAELSGLLIGPDSSTSSKILECRRCHYPDNRWIVLMGTPVRLSDQSDLLRHIID